KGKRRQCLAALEHQPYTLVFYESPRRIIDLLTEMEALLGPRPAVLAREMTKRHEEFLRGSLAEIRAALGKRAEIKGEITLLVGAGSAAAAADWSVVEAALAEALEEGRGSLASIAKAVAKAHNRPRAEVYARALELKKRKESKSDPNPANRPTD
ncbi:MAG: rRNA (cytidine-2'-O-)-methyltransferase, partial [Desulfosarcinaceae bacterium]